MAERDLVVNLVARTKQYQAGMEQSKRATQKYATSTAQAASSQKAMQEQTKRTTAVQKQAAAATVVASGKMSRGSMAATQMTFAVEDAASVWGTQGFSGALRAAGNNLTMVAMLMGGMKGQIIATTAIIGTQLVASLLKTQEIAERAAKGLESFRKSFSRIMTEVDRSKRFQFDLEDIGDSDSAVNRLKELDRELQVNKEKLDKQRFLRSSSVSALGNAQEKKRSLGEAFGEGLESFGLKKKGSAVPEIGRRQSEIKDIGEKIAQLNQRNRQIEEERLKLQKKRTDMQGKEARSLQLQQAGQIFGLKMKQRQEKLDEERERREKIDEASRKLVLKNRRRENSEVSGRTSPTRPNLISGARKGSSEAFEAIRMARANATKSPEVNELEKIRKQADKNSKSVVKAIKQQPMSGMGVGVSFVAGFSEGGN